MLPGENNLQFSNRLYCKIKIKYNTLTISSDLHMVRKFYVLKYLQKLLYISAETVNYLLARNINFRPAFILYKQKKRDEYMLLSNTSYCKLLPRTIAN